MKICLLFPKWTQTYGLFGHFTKRAGRMPPLNLALIGAIAEREKHEVSIIDAEVEELTIEEVLKRIKGTKADIVGITATSPFYHIAVENAVAIKKALKGTTIVIGGPHITVLKEEAFNDCFDYAFIGEADNSWVEFLRAFENKTPISEVKGILYRDSEGKLHYTGASRPVEDINAIPTPARHLLKTDKYMIGTLHGVKNFTTIMTTRGCPFKCIFCSTKVFGNDTRNRSPQLVIEEMKGVIERDGIRHFYFLDDTLTLNKKHFSAICDLIIAEKLNITFEGSTRANLIDEPQIAKMAEAGLIGISFGLESADEKVRELMKKKVPLEAYIIANQLTYKYGIETQNTCMIGLPGETLESVKETLVFLRKSKEIKQVNISIAVPYPGTELFEMANTNMHNMSLISDNFSNFRRYNTAVIKIGDLTPEDLVELQNEAYLSIYAVYWRWLPMIRKSGIFGAFLTLSRLFKILLKGKLPKLLTNKQLGIR
jgi:radical SAM superfamily enzyme YgiQ (UPF0313 family)